MLRVPSRDCYKESFRVRGVGMGSGLRFTGLGFRGVGIRVEGFGLRV